MSKKRKIVLGCAGVSVAAAIIGVLAGVAFLQPWILVVVKNSDATPMSNVRVHVGGKAVDLGSLQPGAATHGRVRASQDSDVRIVYSDAAGLQQEVRIDTYVTNGNRGRIDAEVRGGSLVGSRVRLYYP